jgi:hypothetical protein
MKRIDETNNSQEYKKLRRNKICNETGKCSFCPMHDGENRRRAKRKSKPKYKGKR